MSSVQPGCLWVVATPIGHRDDFSMRAIETLRAVAVIAAEDTRHSRPLLMHYNIDTPLVALHEHNERDAVDAIVRRLQGGESVALISDAGTPLDQRPGLPAGASRTSGRHPLRAGAGPLRGDRSAFRGGSAQRPLRLRRFSAAQGCRAARTVCRNWRAMRARSSSMSRRIAWRRAWPTCAMSSVRRARRVLARELDQAVRDGARRTAWRAGGEGGERPGSAARRARDSGSRSRRGNRCALKRRGSAFSPCCARSCRRPRRPSWRRRSPVRRASCCTRVRGRSFFRRSAPCARSQRHRSVGFSRTGCAPTQGGCGVLTSQASLSRILHYNVARSRPDSRVARKRIEESPGSTGQSAR